MKIDSHISELLYDHDCVIVPSFGGFLASYSHARIHSTQHVISPPSKKIAFNIFLKQNDGLLANQVSIREKLSYTDALNRIEQFVNQWQKELAEGKKLVIDRVGTFYFDSEKNLQFDPVKNINYLREAFGFDAVQYLPVRREDFQEKVESQVNDILRPSSRQEKKQIKLSNKTRQKILSTLIISSSLLWLSSILYLVTPNHSDLSSLNPFSKKNNTEFVREEIKPVKLKPSPESPAKVNSAVIAEVKHDNPPAILEKQEPKSDVAPVQQVTVSKEEQKFFVIGGAFQFIENAESFVKDLHSQGFSDARILDTTKNLKMVCFNGFATRAEALKEVEDIKSHGKDGWIYKW